MSETLSLVRVFLASPGDLSDERGLVKDAVDEINRRISFNLGFRVELLGWEDTLPAAGRPQDLINKEVKLCELFIGILWKRWGTPPNTQGPYSSGFEEEFSIASSMLKETGKPEIAMFFKDIGSQLSVNPEEDLKKVGEDLKRVKKFRETLELEKAIFYKNFSDPYGLQGFVREKITEYLFELKKSEEESAEEEHSKSKNPIGDNEEAQNPALVKSPFSVEGHSFLKSFLEKTEAEDSTENISSLEVARFRLLSSTISKSGNDEPSLGVHDANIIYSNKYIKFGSREISRLIDCGLKNISHENAPLWHWCRVYKEIANENFLTFKSFFDEDVGEGAIEAMKLIGSKLQIEEKYVDRSFIIKRWLSEDRGDAVKLAALRYLKHHGENDDLPLIQSELDRADSQTSRAALEAIISIEFRYNKGEALKTAFANQFESFDEILLEEVLSVPSNLDDETLKIGLKHRNKKVRRESFKRLGEEKKINAAELQELKNDPFAEIRKETVEFLLSNNQPLNDNEIKQILIKPQKIGILGGLFSPTATDEEGQACYDEYLFYKYSKMSEDRLLGIIKKEGIVFDDITYFALCSRYFKNHSEELRENVDNQFKGKFEAHIEHLKNIGVSDETIKKTRNIEGFLRKKLTRKALDILCKKGDTKDLDRIRQNMRSEYVKSSEDEIEFMRKLGEWEDVPFIVKAEKDHATSRSSLTAFTIQNEWYRSISKAIYYIGKVHIGELLKIEMSSHILVDLIKVCSSSKFSEIPDDILMSLLNRNEDKVRKYAALKIIKSLKKSKIEYLLKEYVDSQEYRYYNVIYWLDFGASMPKSMTSKAANLILND